jgi:hypothetical protein
MPTTIRLLAVEHTVLMTKGPAKPDKEIPMTLGAIED